MTENTVARPSASAAISRRRVVQGAAWAAPAIVLATAVPAFAAASDASVTDLGLTIEQNGASRNFILTFTSNITGVSNGELLTLIGSFDAGTATVTVTDNSSGWDVLTSRGTGYSWTATKVHDGAGTIAAAKFKISADDISQVELKEVTIQLYVPDGSGGLQYLGALSGDFPTLQ